MRLLLGLAQLGEGLAWDVNLQQQLFYSYSAVVRVKPCTRKVGSTRVSSEAWLLTGCGRVAKVAALQNGVGAAVLSN